MRGIKYPEKKTLRWTTGWRNVEYEKVKILHKATWFFFVCAATT